MVLSGTFPPPRGSGRGGLPFVVYTGLGLGWVGIGLVDRGLDHSYLVGRGRCHTVHMGQCHTGLSDMVVDCMMLELELVHSCHSYHSYIFVHSMKKYFGNHDEPNWFKVSKSIFLA